MGFEAYEPEQLRVPNRGEFGQLLAGEIGKARDEELALLRVAALSRLPARCPDDALDAVGEAVQIERYPAETHNSYRGRSSKAFPTHKKKGSPEAIEEQIRAWGIPDVRVYMAHELAFLPASPIGYDPNTSPPWYSAFLVMLGPDYGLTGIGPLLAPFAGGPTCTGGSTATREQVRQICNITLRWKAAHSYPVGVALRFDDDTAIGGVNILAPFTPAAAPRYAFWHIGKIAGLNVITAPFTAGGYEY